MSVKKETTLLEDLNQALAAETLAALRYLYLSKIASGINSPPLSMMLKDMAKDEWDHAGALMERIIQLGGVPISKPVTHRLVMDVMVDEAKDEQKLAALLD